MGVSRLVSRRMAMLEASAHKKKGILPILEHGMYHVVEGGEFLFKTNILL